MTNGDERLFSGVIAEMCTDVIAVLAVLSRVLEQNDWHVWKGMSLRRVASRDGHRDGDPGSNASSPDLNPH